MPDQQARGRRRSPPQQELSNPSLLISHRNNDDDQTFGTFGEEPVPVRNVIIDCGKTFRETALRWMPANGIRSIDAIVLTHEVSTRFKRKILFFSFVFFIRFFTLAV